MSNAMMNAAHMMATASAEAVSSCANDMIMMDAILLASILFAILGILGLRLHSLMNLMGLRISSHLKAAVPAFM